MSIGGCGGAGILHAPRTVVYCRGLASPAESNGGGPFGRWLESRLPGERVPGLRPAAARPALGEARRRQEGPGDQGCRAGPADPEGPVRLPGHVPASVATTRTGLDRSTGKPAARQASKPPASWRVRQRYPPRCRASRTRSASPVPSSTRRRSPSGHSPLTSRPAGIGWLRGRWPRANRRRELTLPPVVRWYPPRMPQPAPGGPAATSSGSREWAAAAGVNAGAGEGIGGMERGIGPTSTRSDQPNLPRVPRNTGIPSDNSVITRPGRAAAAQSRPPSAGSLPPPARAARFPQR
jgi:hypothetical protein